jgi:hypothetical protein
MGGFTREVMEIGIWKGNLILAYREQEKEHSGKKNNKKQYNLMAKHFKLEQERHPYTGPPICTHMRTHTPAY